jgi:hypothetical protein
MPNYNQSTRKAVSAINLGLRVDKAAISLAVISTKDLFTVAGGSCVILGLVGESTTGQAAGANNANFVSTPTVGTAVAMSGAVCDIASAEIGGHISLVGVLATNAAMTNAGAAAMMTTPILVPEGVIGIATDANTAGSWKFSIWYLPAEEGAYIVAA